MSEGRLEPRRVQQALVAMLFDPEFAAAVAEFRAEEVEHRDSALAAGAEAAPAYPLLSGLIRIGCRAAIALSKRI